MRKRTGPSARSTLSAKKYSVSMLKSRWLASAWSHPAVTSRWTWNSCLTRYGFSTNARFTGLTAHATNDTATTDAMTSIGTVTSS